MEKLVYNDNVFRRLNKIIDFDKLLIPLQDLYSTTGTEGINVIKGELELYYCNSGRLFRQRNEKKALAENVTIKWF